MNWISTPGATPFLVAAFIAFSVTGSLILVGVVCLQVRGALSVARGES